VTDYYHAVRYRVAAVESRAIQTPNYLTMTLQPLGQGQAVQADQYK
jgi:hypothetical protein